MSWPREPRPPCPLFVLIIALFAITPTLATDLPLTAVYPGAIVDVQLAGDHAFAVTYSGLLVLDLTAPEPTPVAFVPMPDDARGIAIRDQLVYLAPGDVGLRILDVSDPAHPCEVGTCPLPGGYGDLVLGAQHAYVADQYEGILVFDIADPAAPVPVGSLTLSHQVTDLELVGDTLYVAADNAGLRVVDVSQPATPVLIETVDVLGNIGAVTVRDGYAYLAAGLRGLHILDVSGEEIVEVGDVPLDFDLPWGTWSEGVAVAGIYAYATLSGNGIGVVDVSDPTAPVEVTSCELTGRARRIVVRDGLAYTGCWNGGLRLVDVSDPTAPVPAACFETLGMPVDLRVDDDLVYLAGGYTEDESKRSGARGSNTGGLYVVDVADPARPEIVGHGGTSMMPSQIALGGGHAYLSCSLAGIRILDVSDPHAPLQVGEIGATGAYYLDVEVQGDLAFTSDEYQDIRSFDVSDPSTPVQLDVFEGAYWSCLAVRDDLVYAGVYYQGLRIIDAGDPHDLHLVGAVDLPNYSLHVHLDGDRAYVANGHRGLAVIDISKPEAPVEIGLYDTPDHCVGVVVLDGLAYVADREAGVRVIDVRDPAAMVEVACNEDARPAYAVAADETYVYAACSRGGLFVLERLVPTDIQPDAPPRSLTLAQNRPNPFNPRTVIAYELTATEAVDLRVYDLAGRLVRTLVTGRVHIAGRHSVTWDGTDDAGRPVASGTYFYRIAAGTETTGRCMALVR